MIATVQAHGTKKEHGHAQDASVFVGISVIIIMAIFFKVVFRRKK